MERKTTRQIVLDRLESKIEEAEELIQELIREQDVIPSAFIALEISKARVRLGVLVRKRELFEKSILPLN